MSSSAIVILAPLATCLHAVYAQDELLGASFEGILEALKVGPARLPASALLEAALQLKVRRSTLALLEAEYMETRAATQQACVEAPGEGREQQDRSGIQQNSHSTRL